MLLTIGGFRGGGVTAPRGGLSTPRGAPWVLCSHPSGARRRRRPRLCGGLCSLPQVASGLRAVHGAACQVPPAKPQGFSPQGCSASHSASRQRSPWALQCTRAQGRSSPRASVSARSAMLLVQVDDTKDGNARLDPRVGYISMLPGVPQQGTAERGFPTSTSASGSSQASCRRRSHPRRQGQSGFSAQP